MTDETGPKARESAAAPSAAAPTDIAELFRRDPEALTRDDIEAIVAAYRDARAQFALGLKQAGATKKVGPKARPLA